MDINGNDPGADAQNLLNGQGILLRKLLSFANPAIPEQAMKEKIELLGLANISDLRFLEDLDKCFSDVLKPVGIGKLKEFVQGTVEAKPLQDSASSSQVVNFPEIFTPQFLKKLEGKKRLLKDERLKVVRDVGDELRASGRNVTIGLCRKVSGIMESKFGKALGTKDHADLVIQLYNRAKYKTKKKKKQRALTQIPPETHQADVEIRSFTKRQCYGLDPERDLPTEYPPGETTKTQLDKKAKMISMSESGEIDWRSVKTMMQGTYTSQRATVNSLINFEGILKQWPFFGKYRFLEKHFCTLMAINQDDYCNAMTNLFTPFLKFLTADANKKRPGSAARISADLKAIIQKYERNPLGENDSAEGSLMIAIILCLGVKFKEDLKHLFIYFDETTSFDDVEASTKLPEDGKPTVAVLGKDVQSNPNCFVVVDRRVINCDFLTPMKAVLAAFMCHFVLKCTYNRKIAGTMEFMQRSIFQINAPGSRVERMKTGKGWETAPRGVNAKYVTLMRDFEDFRASWEPEPVPDADEEADDFDILL